MRDVLLREAAAVWPVIALWAISLIVLATLTARAAKSLSWREVARLLLDDGGAAYSIEYLLTLPLYMLFIALFIELSLIMVCKTGTVYAAFAAARVGIVWTGESAPSDVDDAVTFAARRAFVPFASGLAEFHAGRGGQTPSADARKFVAAYEAYNRAVANDRVFAKYVAAKYRYSFRTVEAVVQKRAGPAAPWDEDFSVTVSYSYPFGTLGIGRAIGERAADGRYVYPLSTTVTLKSELPQTEETKLGIDYLRLPK